MRKEFIRIALATTIITTAFTVIPIDSTSGITFTKTVEASVKEDCKNTYWHTYTLQTYLELLKDSYISGTELTRSTVSEDLVDTGFLMSDKGVLANGSDITSVIPNCNSLLKYKNRNSLTWTIGKDNIIKYDTEYDSYYMPTNVMSYIFTAPINGEFRVRVSGGIYGDTGAGIRILDSNNKEVYRELSSMSTLSQFGARTDGEYNYIDCEWYTVKVEKGKKYTMEMYTNGYSTEELIDMMFISVLKNMKEYDANKWYVRTYPYTKSKYTLQQEKFLTDIEELNKFEEIIRGTSLIKVKLDSKSKVTLYLMDVSHYIKGVHSYLTELYIYKKDNSARGYSLYKTLSYATGSESDISETISKCVFEAEKGTYYISIDTDATYTYDIAFKYKVKELN